MHGKMYILIFDYFFCHHMLINLSVLSNIWQKSNPVQVEFHAVQAGEKEYDRPFRLKRTYVNSMSWGKLTKSCAYMYFTLPKQQYFVHIYQNTQGNRAFCQEQNNKWFCCLQYYQFQNQCLKCRNKHPVIISDINQPDLSGLQEQLIFILGET